MLKFLASPLTWVLLVSITWLTGCQNSANSSASASTIKIGLAGVRSGSDAAIGEAPIRGSQIAIDEWNAKGGLLGKKIEAIVYDDEGQPDKASAVAQNLVDAGVVAVIGHFNSGCSIPASSKYNDGHVIEISPASTNPKLTDQGFPYVFRICGRDDQQGAVSGSYAADVLKATKIAIMDDKSAYGQGLADEVKKTFEAKGGTVVLYQGIGKDDRDFHSEIALIKSSGAQALFWGGMYGQGGPLLVELRQENLNLPFLSGDGCYDQNFIDTSGNAAQSGVFLTFGKDYRSLPAAKPFLDKYMATYHQAEGAYSVYGYDAANVLFTAIQKAGTTDPDKVTAIMKSTPFDTTLGTIEFDSKGDLKQPGFVVWTVKDGKFTVVSN